MTISPPSNVVLGPDEPARVLAQGVDTLVLAIYLQWRNDSFFEKLAELKSSAKADQKPSSGRLQAQPIGNWIFNVKPHGADGFEWLLSSKLLSMSVGRWGDVKQRPNVMVTISSELLWSHGVDAAVAWVELLLITAGADVVRTQISRVDVCTDLLLPSHEWREELRHHFITRATKVDPHFDRKRLTGFNVGRGKVAARLYDKPLEIAQQSHKYWMYRIWGIDAVPDGHHIIRVEYQLRREALKAFGIDMYADMGPNLPALWSTMTQTWLRLVDDAAKHHTHQKLVPFWGVVQSAVPGAQEANPLVREESIRADEEQLMNQIVGFVTSLVALRRQGEPIAPDEVLDMESHLVEIVRSFRRINWDSERFTEEVKRKQAKFMRHGADFGGSPSAGPRVGVSLRRSA